MPFEGIPFYIMNKSAAAETVVTSGLELYFDAGLSTSYPGSGSTWNDISGNGRTATLNGVYSYASGTGGYFYDLNNFSAYATINSFSKTGLSGLTMQAVFMYDASQYEGAKFLASTNSGGNGFALETRFGGSDIALISDGGSRSAFATVTQNVWNFASATRDVPSLSLTMKINGGSRITNTYASLPNVDFTGGWMWSRNNNGGVIVRGRIAAILFYSKTLSTTEETQNYNYFKTRYSIA